MSTLPQKKGARFRELPTLRFLASESSIPLPALNSQSITCISLNLAHGRKTSAHQLFLPSSTIKRNLKKIATLIRREKPHFVGLQEADKNSFWNGQFSHLEFLARHTQFPFGLHASHMNTAKLEYGTALLSRHNLTQGISAAFSQSLPLPRKGFVMSDVMLPQHSQALTLVSVHLDFMRQSIRNKQVEILARCIADRGLPTIVMGDFNCDFLGKNSPLKTLCQSTGLHTVAPESGSPTFRYRKKRWDWILASPEFTFDEYQALDDVVSDHRAVKAVLNFKGK